MNKKTRYICFENGYLPIIKGVNMQTISELEVLYLLLEMRGLASASGPGHFRGCRRLSTDFGLKLASWNIKTFLFRKVIINNPQ